MTDERPTHLAWHETLELHEMAAMQSTALMKCKLFVGEIDDRTLVHLYRQSISDLERNLKELMRYYPNVQRMEQGNRLLIEIDDSFFAAELLSFVKALIKGLAAAITETATQSLKDVFIGQLTRAIQCHTNAFNYMHKNGHYPAYDLPKLLENDQKNVKKALEM